MTKQNREKEKVRNPEVRKRILEKTFGRCAYCGTELNKLELEIDHVEPISRGGADSEENMLACCGFCNRSKGPMKLEIFRRHLERTAEKTGTNITIFKKYFGLEPKKIVFYFETLDPIPYTPPERK